MFVITQTIRTASSHPLVNLHYQGVLLLSMESRGARPWEAVQTSPTLRQQFIDRLEAAGLNAEEIAKVMRRTANGVAPNYAREKNREG